MARDKERYPQSAGPQPEGKDENGRPNRKTFSLSRTQMAFWFFLVIVSYVFIWMVSDVYSILTTSVLTLIGISSATAMGTTIIDGNKGKSTSRDPSVRNTSLEDNELTYEPFYEDCSGYERYVYFLTNHHKNTVAYIQNPQIFSFSSTFLAKQINVRYNFHKLLVLCYYFI